MWDAGRSNGNIEIKREFKPVPFEEAIILTGWTVNISLGKA
uniref:Uncharacterized protein n=1 Tax=Timema poppense TaxID=170557 RepID=A0A7R9HEZ0_TIMPO|nr:unnamed protein product [Timema poppensis]